MNKITQKIAVMAAGAVLLLPVLVQAQHYHGVQVRDIDRAIAITDIISRVLFPTQVVVTPAPVVVTPAYPMVIQQTHYYPLDPFPVEPPRIVVEPVFRAPVIVQPMYHAPVIVQPMYYPRVIVQPRPVYRSPVIVSPPSYGGHDRHQRHDYQQPRGGRDDGRGGGRYGGRDSGRGGGREGGGRDGGGRRR